MTVRFSAVAIFKICIIGGFLMGKCLSAISFSRRYLQLARFSCIILTLGLLTVPARAETQYILAPMSPATNFTTAPPVGSGHRSMMMLSAVSGNFFSAYMGERVPLQAWGIFSIPSCQPLGPADENVTRAPQHGTLGFTVISGTVTGSICTGRQGTFTQPAYTWTDASAALGTEDPFSIHWFSTQYGVSFGESYTAVLNTDTSKGLGICVPCLAKENGAGVYTPVTNTGTVAAGNPVNIGIGNKFEQVEDYATAGRNPLRLVRYYNSMAADKTDAMELGSKWRDNYDRYLDVSIGTVTAERADGQILTFIKNADNSWTSDTDVDLTLTNVGASWYLTDHSDTVETYYQPSSSNTAYLQRIVTRGGYERDLAYNANNQLASVTDSFGRKLGFAYNSAGLLSQVTTPGNLVLTYGYDSSGANGSTLDRLTSVSYNTTPATDRIYSYVNNFDLASITDEDGNVYAQWTYDDKDRATSSQHAGGAGKVTISYDSDTQRTVTGPLGQQTVYTFQTLQGVPKVVKIARAASGTVPAGTESFTYDSNGYVASKTDWNGNVTDYINDAHGDPTSITEAAGTALARTTTIAYGGPTGRLPGEIVAPNLTTHYTYDRYGNVLTRQETDTATPGGATRTWVYTYDQDGHMLTMTDPRGNVTTYTYDGDNLATITNALGQTSKITSYNASGLPLSMTDPNGITTTFTYDIRNRLLSRTIDGATTAFAYDPAGNLTHITLPDGAELNYTYDAAHRVTAVSNNVGDTINYTLDANGDITGQQVAGNGTITETQSALFDSLGRMLKQIGAYNETTSYAYDANGNGIGTTDALGNTTAQSFDALNRLIKSVDPLSNATSYAYDAEDNLTSVTDPRGLATTYTYDGFGDVLSRTSPDTGTTTYAYDAAGNPIRQTDARGVETDHTFDALNRVLTETYPASPGENVTYTYDQGPYGIGHLTSFTDASGATAYTYNARGDIVSDRRTIGRSRYATFYTYDAADRLTSITYPDGRTVNVARDAFGRVSGITLSQGANHDDRDDWRDHDRWGGWHNRHHGGGQDIVSNVTYEPFGPVNGFAYGNGVAETLSYDQDYRLTGIAAKGNGKFIQDQTLTYDPVSDITAINDLAAQADKDQARDRDGRGYDRGDGRGDDRGDHDRGWGDDRKAPSLNQTFTYDPDMRLLTATGAYGTQTFAYDADGNRLSESFTQRYGRSDNTRTRTGSYAYDTASNMLQSVSGLDGMQYTYTSNGDLAREANGRTDRSFTYDARNRLSSLTNQGMSAATVRYKTNALGERVQKSGASDGLNDFDDATDYIYDEQGRLIAEGHDGRISREYIYLGSLPVAELTHGQVYYVHDNHLGAPQKMTNAQQRIVWNRISEPFGKTFALKGDQDLMNLRFPGQYHDAESGLDYNMFRSYDPTIGRYTQSDPIGLSGGINTYAYVGGNPVNWIDPMGLAGGSEEETRGGGLIDTDPTAPIREWQFWNTYKDLQKIDPSNLNLEFVSGPNFIPTNSDIEALQTALDNARIKNSEKATGVCTAKTVVIGEDMSGRVIPTAKANNAEWYSPPNSPPEQWMENNKNWINQKMNEGCTILDCGAAPGRASYPSPTSPYYQMERQQIQLRNYQNYKQIQSVVK